MRRFSDFLVTRLDPVPRSWSLRPCSPSCSWRSSAPTGTVPGCTGVLCRWSGCSARWSPTSPTSHSAFPYAVSTPVFFAALVVVFVLWRRVEGTVDVHTITSTRRQLFYWAAVIATFAMGTAAGDLAASTFHLGYLGGGLVFVAAMIIVVLARLTALLRTGHGVLDRVRPHPPVGASFADYLAVPHARGGLDVGTGLVSAVLLIAIAFAVAMQEKVRRIPSTEAASSVR